MKEKDSQLQHSEKLKFFSSSGNFSNEIFSTEKLSNIVIASPPDATNKHHLPYCYSVTSYWDGNLVCWKIAREMVLSGIWRYFDRFWKKLKDTKMLLNWLKYVGQNQITSIKNGSYTITNDRFHTKFLGQKYTWYSNSVNMIWLVY